MIAGLPMKQVDPRVIDHPVERRGFVTVPLDHHEPDHHDPGAGPTIDIFYRLIPSLGARVDDPTRPILVVINGGPGIPSSFYRPLDYDYAASAMPARAAGALDRFKHLLTTHRVLIADQRGTDGQSAPLDMDDPSLDPNLVARYFSSDSHALDYLAVVDHVVPPGEDYWVIAQSYGGMPGMQLVAHADRHQPRGIVFSSSALPFEDPLEAMRARRREQLRLNLHLGAVVPDIADRLAATRAHCAAVGVDPSVVHGLYALLGKDVPGVWEAEVVKRLDKIQGQAREAIMADVEAGLELPSLLNYILSSCNFSPGWTDRTMAALGSREIPFEPWMIDEHEMLVRTGQDGSWRQAMVEAIDRAPPPATPFPTLEALRAALARGHALFTAADNDAFVPGDSYKDTVARFLVEGRTAVRTLPGGHHAIFLAKGHEALLEWSRSFEA